MDCPRSGGCSLHVRDCPTESDLALPWPFSFVLIFLCLDLPFSFGARRCYIGNRRAISRPPIAIATAMANKQSRTVTALDRAQPIIIADRDGCQGQTGRNEQGEHEHRGHDTNLTVLPSRLVPVGASSTR